MNDDIKIIYSDAYKAIDAWRSATYSVEAAEDEARSAAERLKEAKAEAKRAKEAMLDALMSHYGELPEAIDYMGSLLLIQSQDCDAIDVRIIKARSYCDLYQVIKPEGEAA